MITIFLFYKRRRIFGIKEGEEMNDELWNNHVSPYWALVWEIYFLIRQVQAIF
jgi:hypothetical protein